jgi:hypothetical protein
LVLIPLLQTQQSQDTETRSNEPQFKEWKKSLTWKFSFY